MGLFTKMINKNYLQTNVEIALIIKIAFHVGNDDFKSAMISLVSYVMANCDPQSQAFHNTLEVQNSMFPELSTNKNDEENDLLSSDDAYKDDNINISNNTNNKPNNISYNKPNITSQNDKMQVIGLNNHSNTLVNLCSDSENNSKEQQHNDDDMEDID